MDDIFRTEASHPEEGHTTNQQETTSRIFDLLENESQFTPDESNNSPPIVVTCGNNEVANQILREQQSTCVFATLSFEAIFVKHIYFVT